MATIMVQQAWLVYLAVVAMLPPKVGHNALDIAVKVHLRVAMGGGDHLWKVNDGDVLVVRDHQVELVEIAVDQATARELQDEFHEAPCHPARMFDAAHAAQGVPWRHRHDDAVPVAINRRGCGESSLVQGLLRSNHGPW